MSQYFNTHIDAFSFLRQNLNPAGLDRKPEMQLEQDYVKMILGACIPHKFNTYTRDNFIKLCQPHVTYQKIFFGFIFNNWKQKTFTTTTLLLPKINEKQQQQ